MSKKTNYLLFCSKCFMPQQLPNYIIAMYFTPGVAGVYCKNETCNELIVIPDHLKKLKEEL
jgi:hypothetical protein